MKSQSEMDPGGTAGQVHLLLDAVDVFVEFRSHHRVAEDFIVTSQQVEKEEGKRNGKIIPVGVLLPLTRDTGK